MESAEPGSAGNGAGDAAASQAGADGDAASRLRTATRTAESLTELLRELESHVGALDAQAEEAERRAQEAEAGTAQVAAFRSTLLEAAGGVSPEEVGKMRELADALVRKPSDLLIMVKLSEQAQTLAAIVRAHERVLNALRSGDA